jgi:two-component system chemotaxis response regulator CheY
MMRVLVVEDTDETRELLVSLCHMEGCDVETAEDGEQGAELFERAVSEARPFRLVILDLAMPVMDGASAAKRMRAAEEEAGTAGKRRAHIEGYTGHGEHVESVDSFLRAGIDHLTVKPGELAAWQALIHSLMADAG